MTTWQLTPFSLLYIAGIVIALTMAVIAWRIQPVRGAREFAFTAIGVSFWFLGYVLGFFNSDLEWKLIAVRIEYIGIVSSPVLFFLFVAAYVQLRLPKGWQFLLFVPAALTLMVVFTFPYHQLLYEEFGKATLASGFVVFTKAYGPFFYFWMSFSYVVMMASLLALVWGLGKMPVNYRFQATVLSMIVATILVANLAFVSGFNPIAPYDPTPIAFLLAAVLILVNMRLFRFLDIVPVAYNQVFEQVPTGVIVVDSRDKIIDINQFAEGVLGEKDEVLGRRADTLLDVSRDHYDSIELGSTGREFDIDITPFKESMGEQAGRLILLHDVTQRNEMAGQQEALIKELRKALSDVRTLEGMLPICASCKKIKNEEDNSWHELDEFINQHSSAQFSHGICPTCAKLLYPDFSSDD